MTYAEIQRYIEGATWRYKNQAQFDYMLANLIGVSVGRLFDNKANMPAIEEVYPNLFEKEINETQISEEETRMRNSENRFLEFAKRHNAKMKKEAENK